MRNKLNQAMIFAAGIGKRLSPITNTIPKALLPINGVPLLEQLILKLKQESIERIVINVHHFPKQIENFIKTNKNFGIDILISDESNTLLDTGGGLFYAKKLFDLNEPILLYNVDILSNINLKKMFEYHIHNNPLVTLAIRNRQTSRYLEFDQYFNLIGRYQQENSGEDFNLISRQYNTIAAFSGIHIINPEIFELNNDSGAFSIIDFYIRICKEHRILGYQHNTDSWMDCGTYDKIKSMLRPIDQ